MTAKGRIGVIIPMITDSLNAELLDGIYSQAKKLGYDVLVFTNATNSMREFPLTDYVKGEENIFSLAEAAELDGILFAAGCFFNPDLIERIMNALKKHGIRVPEDIHVTGYDGSMNASLHEPILSCQRQG